jgi:hypothetical protein
LNAEDRALVYEPAATLAPQARSRPPTIYKAPLAALWTWIQWYPPEAAPEPDIAMPVIIQIIAR